MTNQIWFYSFLYTPFDPNNKSPPSIHSGPKLFVENIAKDIICPFCKKNTLVSSDTHFKMPKSTTLKEATAEFSCPSCKTFYWRLKK